jgi:hypothetical protein
VKNRNDALEKLLHFIRLLLDYFSTYADHDLTLQSPLREALVSNPIQVATCAPQLEDLNPSRRDIFTRQTLSLMATSS